MHTSIALFFMLEYRAFKLSELRAKADKLGISGHAAVFNQLSDDLGGFKETIRPGAFASSISRDDIRLLVNHEGLPLARNKSGNLKLIEDDTGLAIEADLEPTDPDVQRLMPKINRGDVDQMSFGFRTLRDDWRVDAGLVVRELIEVRLFDVSPVTFPAYPQTDVSAREARSFYQNRIEALKVPSPVDPLIELSLRQHRLKLTERLLRGGIHG